jgi:hypothetical protein
MMARPLFPATSDIFDNWTVAHQMAHAVCPKYVYKFRTAVCQLPEDDVGSHPSIKALTKSGVPTGPVSSRNNDAAEALRPVVAQIFGVPDLTGAPRPAAAGAATR